MPRRKKMSRIQMCGRRKGPNELLGTHKGRVYGLGSRNDLTAALAESKRRRVAEQESMSETVQQIKEQVMNLARRPITSAPNDTADESDDDDYVEPTP
ncbi:hypothetical protein MTR67_020072 [Solanum verrucosum]|uniref:Uncharacterized protein n=1 Tax=Solanum verrucosum TaxID=315347 RepID=A0AAF0QPX4_SOLVR|nr:hypothetical protein MTR67_020072 [Solanum verrucosum]